jgi:hypothetical protein
MACPPFFRLVFPVAGVNIGLLPDTHVRHFKLTEFYTSGLRESKFIWNETGDISRADLSVIRGVLACNRRFQRGPE